MPKGEKGDFLEYRTRAGKKDPNLDEAHDSERAGRTRNSLSVGNKEKKTRPQIKKFERKARRDRSPKGGVSQTKPIQISFQALQQTH